MIYEIKRVALILLSINFLVIRILNALPSSSSNLLLLSSNFYCIQFSPSKCGGFFVRCHHHQPGASFSFSAVYHNIGSKNSGPRYIYMYLTEFPDSSCENLVSKPYGS
ncbi:hypothetical protein DERF_002300 [Dermatophagoides farinae]|uniref:Uncharacterized protein n=1 Tax=Dermatophagoides farinae TaxID=6954 RepID=A0A922ICR8_DERFA|nr:hypothetical protein DERF_002300 [Dermatophagoides farinae]